jgi:exodeoxyribonuclease VII small subunit
MISESKIIFIGAIFSILLNKFYFNCDSIHPSFHIGDRLVAKKDDFEKTLEKLEKIVGNLENGDLSLDESLKNFEEGIKHYQECKKKLVDIEKKITVLTEKLDE